MMVIYTIRSNVLNIDSPSVARGLRYFSTQLSYDLLLMITLLVSSHFWSLHRLSYDLRLIITHLVSSHFLLRNGDKFKILTTRLTACG
jgi:hypothetical protein